MTTAPENTAMPQPQLVFPEPEIDKTNPWKDDALNRGQAANALTNLIKSQRGPFVVSLDGKWGTGKTFFLTRWKNQLENEFRVIYFNAWKDDFCSDPLVAMLAQIVNAQIVKQCKDIKIKKSLSDNAKEIAYNNLESVVKRFLGLQIPRIGDKILAKYEDQVASVSRLREAMAKFLEEDRPLVCIVDELDRCRPDFAIATLERTKHVLNIPGLMFVYGINRSELCESIKSLYGNIDADIYLRRIFDMEFTLPTVSRRSYCAHVAERYRTKMIIDESVGSDYAEGFDDAITRIPSTIEDLSLRDIEQCIRMATFAAGNMAQNRIGYQPHVIVAVIVIRLIAPDLYQRFVNGDHVAGEMLTLLEKRIDKTAYPSGDHSWINLIPAFLYAVCDEEMPHDATALSQMRHLRQHRLNDSGEELPSTTLLAESTKRADVEELEDMIRTASNSKPWEDRRGHRWIDRWKRHLVSLIELSSGP